MARAETNSEQPRKGNPVPPSRAAMKQQIIEEKAARVDERAQRRAAAEAAAAEAAAADSAAKLKAAEDAMEANDDGFMEVDEFLGETEEEKEYLRNEARLAAEAQVNIGNTADEDGNTGEDISGGVSHSGQQEQVVGTPIAGGKVVGFDVQLNQHLADLNVADGGGEVDTSTQSPLKKKSRGSAPATPGLKGARPTGSILKPNAPHKFNNKRIILEAAIMLVDTNPYLQFAENLRSLLTNALLVDATFQIEPLSATSLRLPLKRGQDIPNNMTLLTEYVRISGNMMAFQKKKAFGGGSSSGRKKKGETQDRDPVVWFSFAASYDVDSTYLLYRIGFDWTERGGSRLQVKSVYSFETVTPIMCLKLWVGTNEEALIAEFQSILKETWEVERNDLAPKYGNEFVMPAMGIRITSPWIPGAKPVEWKIQNSRKVVHFEMDSAQAKLVKHLVERAKDLGLVAAKWGIKAILTETGVPLTQSNAERLVSSLRSHASFMARMQEEKLIGVDQLDVKVPFYKVSDPTVVLGELSLRDLLLKYLKLPDGKPAIAEVHQAGPMTQAWVIFPNVSDAEMMVARMNKNIAAYLYFVLQEEGIPEEFLKRLLKEACNVEIYEEGMTYTWDEEYRTILSPKDVQGAEAAMAEQEEDAWYSGERGNHMNEKGKKAMKKKAYTRREDMFDLESVGSVKTIHESNARRAARAAKVAKDLSSDEEEEDSEDNGDRKRSGRASSMKKTSSKHEDSDSESEEEEDDSEEEQVKASKDKKKKKKKTNKDSASKNQHGKSRASKHSRETIEISSSSSDSSSTSSSDSSDESESEDDGTGSG